MQQQIFALFCLLCAAAADTSSNKQPHSAVRGVISDAQVLPGGSQGQGATPPGQPGVQVSPQTQSVAAPGQSSNILGASALVLIVIGVTSVLCCILACCVAKQVCGCLFGGVEDICDGDGHIGTTAQAEEAGMAGLAGYELANKGLF